jgi:hypothetical protein
MIQKASVICRVASLARRPNTDSAHEWVVNKFWTVVNFLQQNGLTVRQLAESRDAITDAFELRSADLTSDGLKFMRTGYHKWLRMLDRGGDPRDARILERELAKMEIDRERAAFLSQPKA